MSDKNGWWDTEEDIQSGNCLFKKDKPYYVTIKDIGQVLCTWNGFTFIPHEPVEIEGIMRMIDIDPLTILAVKDIFSLKSA